MEQIKLLTKEIILDVICGCLNTKEKKGNGGNNLKEENKIKLFVKCIDTELRKYKTEEKIQRIEQYLELVFWLDYHLKMLLIKNKIKKCINKQHGVMMTEQLSLSYLDVFVYPFNENEFWKRLYYKLEARGYLSRGVYSDW